MSWMACVHLEPGHVCLLGDTRKVETVHDTMETLRIKEVLDIHQVDDGTVTSNDTPADDGFKGCSSTLWLSEQPI